MRRGVTWDLYGEIRGAFDALGPGYDRQFPVHPMVHRARALAAARLAVVTRPGEWWLELGCGTGRDAIPLARRGVNVLATDISPAMLAELNRKRKEISCVGEIRTEPLVAAQAARLQPEWGGRLDGAFAFFGALNGESDLAPVAQALASLLRPGGQFLATVSSRYCLWEWLIFLPRRAWRLAFRRQRPGTPIRVGVRDVRIITWTPGAVVRAFKPWFETTAIEGLNVLTPPHYVLDPRRHLGRALDWLDWLDRRVCRWPVARALGDHFLVEMRRR